MSQHTGHETDTPDEPTGLTQAQEQAITALLTEPTIARAAQAVGVSERTLHRWLARPDFRAHYLKARRNVFDQAVALTHKYAPLAVNTLARTLSDPSAPWATRTAAAVGRFFFTTMAALAQLERDQVSERTQLAMAHKKALGQRTGGNVPYGYRLTDDGRSVVPCEEEQAAVSRILTMTAQGLSTREINAALLADGVLPRRGKHWHPKVLMEIRRRGE